MSERRSLWACLLALCLALLAGLCACGSDEEKGERQASVQAGDAPAIATTAPEAASQSVPEPAPEPPLSPEERTLAERALDFHNTALHALERGHYALADALNANTAFYLKTWHLPKRPRAMGKRQSDRARLTPGAGLFNEEEAAKLAKALDGMDKALDSLLGKYAALESYVADNRIRDDGARGKSLARSIAGEHAVFMAARKTWLDIVEARAAEAEAVLLREHPLRRQIEAAGAIFAACAQVADVIGAVEEAPSADKGGSPKAAQPSTEAATQATLDAAARATLTHIHTELDNRIAEAARPPFAAAPQLERLYRAFLQEAQAYAGALGRGLDEGFFPLQRRELNLAAERSRAAYNAFVREANGLRVR